eukprot:932-Heterococcus_DN1.PRE.4
MRIAALNRRKAALTMQPCKTWPCLHQSNTAHMHVGSVTLTHQALLHRCCLGIGSLLSYSNARQLAHCANAVRLYGDHASRRRHSLTLLASLLLLCYTAACAITTDKSRTQARAAAARNRGCQ